MDELVMFNFLIKVNKILLCFLVCCALLSFNCSSTSEKSKFEAVGIQQNDTVINISENDGISRKGANYQTEFDSIIQLPPCLFQKDSEFVSDGFYKAEHLEISKDVSRFNYLIKNDSIVKFDAIFKYRNYNVKGKLYSVNDLHTAHYLCSTSDFDYCNSRECMPIILHDVLYLLRILSNDTLICQLMKASKEIKYSTTNRNAVYFMTSSGGNINECTITVTDLFNKSLVVELIIRDVGDVYPAKICLK